MTGQTTNAWPDDEPGGRRRGPARSASDPDRWSDAGFGGRFDSVFDGTFDEAFDGAFDRAVADSYDPALDGPNRGRRKRSGGVSGRLAGHPSGLSGDLPGGLSSDGADRRFDAEAAAWGDLGQAGLGPTVDLVMEAEGGRLVHLFTRGLWHLGVPELYLSAPVDLGAGLQQPPGGARRNVFLASGLVHLGYRLLASPAFDVPAYEADFDGRPVAFRLAGHEPPGDRLARELGAEVDTVIRVDCSLWPARPAGSD